MTGFVRYVYGDLPIAYVVALANRGKYTMLLMTCVYLVRQIHQGLLGLSIKALSRACGNIYHSTIGSRGLIRVNNPNDCRPGQLWSLTLISIIISLLPIFCWNKPQELNLAESLDFCDCLDIVLVEELMPVEKDTTDSGVHARTHW